MISVRLKTKNVAKIESRCTTASDWIFPINSCDEGNGVLREGSAILTTFKVGIHSVDFSTNSHGIDPGYICC